MHFLIMEETRILGTCGGAEGYNSLLWGIMGPSFRVAPLLVSRGYLSAINNQYALLLAQMPLTLRADLCPCCIRILRSINFSVSAVSFY